MDASPLFLAQLFKKEKLVKLPAIKMELPVMEQVTTMVFLSKEEFAAHGPMLEAMLAGCKLSPEQYVIFQDEYPIFPQIQGSSVQNLLLVHTNPADLGLQLRLPSIGLIAFAGKTIITLPTLSAIAQNQQLKKDIWIRLLKPYFVDKTTGNYEN